MAEPLTRLQLDEALDHGCLWAKMTHGRWWRCRRGGQTRINGGVWYIPIKTGLRKHGRIYEHAANTDNFQISSTQPGEKNAR